VAATNANLLDMVEKQTFRGDLYHSLAEYTISIPVLKDRKEDLEFLVERFLAQTNSELGRRVRGPNAAAWDLIQAYAWPGNARELRNQLRRAVLMCDDPAGTIIPKYLGMISGPQVACMQQLDGEGVGIKTCWSDSGACLLCGSASELLKTGADLPLKELTARVTSEIERSILLKVLEMTQCNKAQAARMLHIDYKTLHKKLKEHSIFSNSTLNDHNAVDSEARYPWSTPAPTHRAKRMCLASGCWRYLPVTTATLTLQPFAVMRSVRRFLGWRKSSAKTRCVARCRA
jgi:DNA-binding NtrC family response regulator